MYIPLIIIHVIWYRVFTGDEVQIIFM